MSVSQQKKIFVFIKNQNLGGNLKEFNQSVVSEQQDGLEWEEEIRKWLNLNAIFIRDSIAEPLYFLKVSTIEYLQWKILDKLVNKEYNAHILQQEKL